MAEENNLEIEEEIAVPAVSHNYNYSYYDIFDMEDIEDRRLYIESDINEDSVGDIAYHIMRYNRMDKDLPVEERTPIIIFINSPGGNVTDGYGIIDVIINSKTPVYTVNEAIAYSMAYLIYLAGHKRYSMPHSTFLMHDGSNCGFDSSGKLADRMEFELKQMEKATKEYVLSHSKITSDIYDSKYRVEWYMYPEEAKQYGIVDYIIGEDCELDDIL